VLVALVKRQQIHLVWLKIFVAQRYYFVTLHDYKAYSFNTKIHGEFATRYCVVRVSFLSFSSCAWMCSYIQQNFVWVWLCVSGALC